LGAFVGFQLFYCSIDPAFSEPFLAAKEFPECFLVDVLLPLEFVVVGDLRVLEQLSGFFKGEVLLLGQDEFDLAFPLVLALAVLEYVLDAVELLDEFVGFHWSDPLYFGGVVAAAEYAHVHELLLGQCEVLQYLFPGDFCEWLFFVVYVPYHDLRAKY
jgi:hypothetical protein